MNSVPQRVPEGRVRTLDDRKVRALCIRGLFMQVLHVPLTVIVSMAKFPPKGPDWSGPARLIALIISAYGLLAPFAIAALLHKSRMHFRVHGLGLDALLALVRIFGSVFPMFCGFALAVLGDRVPFHHLGFLLSVLGMGYWSWRERAFLFRAERATLPEDRT